MQKSLGSLRECPQLARAFGLFLIHLLLFVATLHLGCRRSAADLIAAFIVFNFNRCDFGRGWRFFWLRRRGIDRSDHRDKANKDHKHI